ncbi:hypothetical protein INT47_003516 [Mucor saturninus]|uniref:CCHC-type domain-containing protein n=1 Tax=Mucor saturninus TaxID=64648 RepID=A0A8H7QK36_9FUNG|nr:hypothetical protein INT47_003516 [Mucor saturninus]
MVPVTIVSPFSMIHGFETEKYSLEVLKQKCVDNGTSIKIVIDIKHSRLKSAKPPSTEVPLSSSRHSEDTPVNNSHQTQITSDDIPISVDLNMVVDDESEDEERDDEEVYDFIEQNNSTDPDWVLKRVRRYVPSPNVLLPVVDNLFNVYGYIKCTVTVFPLFYRHGWKQAKAVLEAIRKGHVSDPPGILFYYLVKRDSRGLPVYCCTRGPFLADCTFADYRLRHNISVGSRNRFNIEHRSHYNPSLVQALNTLRADVDQEFIPSYADSYGNSHHLVDSNEQFGICPVSQEVIDTFNYLLTFRQDFELLSQGRKLINDEKDFNIQVLTQYVLEVSSLVAVKLPTVKMLMLNFMLHNNTNPQVFSDVLRSTKYNKYHYLASRQGIRFALTPVHTYEEYKLDTILANQAQCDMMRSNIRHESRLVNAQRPNTFTHLGSSELSSNVISNDLNVPVIISSLQTPEITRPARIIAPALMTPIDSSSSFTFQQLHRSPRMQIPRLQNNFTSATTTTTTTANRGNFYILPPKERKPRTCKKCNSSSCKGKMNRNFCNSQTMAEEYTCGGYFEGELSLILDISAGYIDASGDKVKNEPLTNNLYLEKCDCFASATFKGAPTVCHWCRLAGLVRSKCPDLAKTKCFSCHGNGHTAKFCKRKKHGVTELPVLDEIPIDLPSPTVDSFQAQVFSDSDTDIFDVSTSPKFEPSGSAASKFATTVASVSMEVDNVEDIIDIIIKLFVTSH